MLYKAVIFDLDGTLLDTLTDLAASVNAVLASLHRPTFAEEDYRFFVGDGLQALVQRALGTAADEALVEMVSAQVKMDYSQRWRKNSRPYAGVMEMLRRLSEAEVSLGVLSNKPDEFVHVMVESLLGREFFAHVQGQRESIPPKPDPRGALNIGAAMGVPVEKIIFVGDTSTDMKTATAAQMYPVGVLWGFRSAAELHNHGAKRLISEPQALCSFFPQCR